MTKSILVSGATGKQGSAVIEALLETGIDVEILALTRNPHKRSAQSLLELSPRIKLITGNLNDPKEIFWRAEEVSETPVWGIFSVQPISIGPGADTKLEERQGKALIDVALENNVRHFVYSSVDRGGLNSDCESTNIPHFISKHNIERYLQERSEGSEMSWTILRPVAFFENLVPGFMGKVFATSLKKSLKNGRKLQFVATSDVGYFAALCFSRIEEFRYRKLSLAGDELTYAQFKQIFKNMTGQKLPTTLGIITSLLNRIFGELGCMFRWFQEYGYGADIDRVKELSPRPRNFAAWLREDSQFTTLKVVETYQTSKAGSILVVKQM